MDSAEFAEHLADYRIEPWGDDWDRTALIVQTIANMSGKQVKREVKLEDCKPKPRVAKRQTPQQIEAMVNLVMKRAQKCRA